MKLSKENNTLRLSGTVLKLLGFIPVLFFISLLTTSAQSTRKQGFINTNKTNPIRSNSFKTRSGFQRANTFVTQQRKNMYWGKVSKKEKPFLKDIAGRRLRTRRYHPQPTRLNYISNFKTGRYWGKMSKKEKPFLKDIAGRRLRTRHYHPQPTRLNYISNFKAGRYWGKVSKKEKPFLKDIAGRRLRTRRYHPQPTRLNYISNFKAGRYGTKPRNDRSHSDWNLGWFAKWNRARITSDLKKEKRAWKGDLSGRKIRQNQTPYRDSPQKYFSAKVPSSIKRNMRRTALFTGNFLRSKMNKSKGEEAAMMAGNFPVKIRQTPAGRAHKEAWSGSRVPIGVRYTKAGTKKEAWSGFKIPFGIPYPKPIVKVAHYRGNTKKRKFTGRGFHPDSQFAHGFRNNVKGERTVFMDIKLFSEKLLNKNGLQPPHVKEKGKKMRYDNREKNLWYR